MSRKHAREHNDCGYSPSLVPQSTVWGGYTRISEDPDDLRGGVGRQRDDITAGVRAAGGDPELVVWYEENDTSAFRKKAITVTDPVGNSYTGYRVIRPVWHQAIHDLRTGRIQALMVYNLDRLARDQRDLADAVEVVRYYGARIESAVAGQIDLRSDGGVAMAEVLTAMNNKASADTGRRVRRVHKDLAQQGAAVGGNRPFGFDRDRATKSLTHRPYEAGLIRWAAKEVIEGTPVDAIARSWTNDGITTVRGGPWKAQTIRQILRGPHIAGWRVSHGAIVMDSDGNPVRGNWEPILDQETWERVVSALRVPDNRRRVPVKGRRQYMLSGLMKCGVCWGPMYGNNYGKSAPGELFYYMCTGTHDNKHSVSISGRSTDQLVAAASLDRVATSQFETKRPAFAREAELGAARRKRSELMAAYDAGQLPAELVFARVESLGDEIAVLEAERKHYVEQSLGPSLKSMNENAWEELKDQVSKRRAWLEKLVDAVVVQPAKSHTGRRYDQRRVKIVWKG